MADDAVFQEAVEALRVGNRSRARELLTELLKTDQNNVTYWIWLSATMETTKERVYCLQTALKLDPENVTAKRGLILLGALPADETVQPFPLNRPRAWEERLLLAHEKPKPKGWAAVKASPVFRLGLIILLFVALASGAVFVVVLPRFAPQEQRPDTVTPGPSPTYTLTVTAIGAKPQAQIPGTPGGAGSDLLPPGVSYSPTPLYVDTPRSPISNDSYRQFISAYQKRDWDRAIGAMNEIIRNEPDTVYAYYYLGEAYRFKGDSGNAFQQYSLALQKDSNFGPAYVGQARTELMNNPNANVLALLDQAIQSDPNFGEAYLERGNIKLRDNDITGALNDFSEANTRIPNSPLVFFSLAQAHLKAGDLERALGAAKRSNELDVTYLPTYLLLGELYAKTGDSVESGKALDIYIKHASGDVSAYVLLGKINFENGKYKETIQIMDQVTSLEPTRREAYLYRFLANVELGNGTAADKDLDAAMRFYPDLFEANIALVRDHVLQGRFGSAELALDKTESLAQTDEQKALIYYWSGIVYEKRNNSKKAAGYWQLLLALPEKAMTADMRKEAEKHAPAISTATASAGSSQTPEPTNTNKSTAPTKPVTATPSPSGTLTPTPTK